MPVRQGLRSTSSLLGAAIVGGGAAYSGYTYFRTSLPLPIAHAEAPGSYAPVASVSPLKQFTGAFGFTDLKLESVETVNHNVKRFRFRLTDDQAESGLSTVSSLLSKHTPEGKWIPVIRPYTPIIIDEPGYVTFLVKKYPNGKASGKLHSMQPGDNLSFRGPLKEFQYTPSEHSHITLVGGGSGITPLYQLTRQVFQNPADKTKITLVYGVNTEEDLLLKSEFDAFANRYPDRFKAVYAVSAPKGTGDFHNGYITKEILKQAMPNPTTEKNPKILVSGPPLMQQAIAGKNGWFFTQGSVGGILAELGYTKDAVHKF